MPSTAADLRRFQKPGVATFTDHEGGLTALDVSTPQATGRLFLQGAQVTAWQPAGHEPLLFCSGKSHFAPGRAIRGGVPVIFPWFGAKADEPDFPQHGFARTSEWEVMSVDHEVDLGVTVVLWLHDSEESRTLWPHAFTAEFRVTFGHMLHTMLKIQNRHPAAIEFEEALHTYLAVSDAREVKILGLEGATFLDKVDGSQRKPPAGDPIVFTGETDRVYLDTESAIHLEDPGLRRRITVQKTGSGSTVVWNPWIEKARRMSDFGDDEWPRMVCIETANAADDAVSVEPGAIHTLIADISVHAMA